MPQDEINDHDESIVEDIKYSLNFQDKNPHQSGVKVTENVLD
jgi:hypothetical protein